MVLFQFLHTLKIDGVDACIHAHKIVENTYFYTYICQHQEIVNSRKPAFNCNKCGVGVSSQLDGKGDEKIVVLFPNVLFLFVIVVKNHKRAGPAWWKLIFCGYMTVISVSLTNVTLLSHVRCTDSVTLTCSLTTTATPWRLDCNQVNSAIIGLVFVKAILTIVC